MVNRVRVNPHVARNNCSGRAYALHTRSRRVVSLQDTASMIWCMLDSWTSIPVIVARLQERFPSVPAGTLRDDAQSFLDSLWCLGFVDKDGEPPPAGPQAADAAAGEEQKALRLWAAEAGVPLWADLELTLTCNLDCRHCYLDSRRDTLPPTAAMAAINDLAALGCLAVGFTGGEPLTHPAAVDLAEHAGSKHLWVRLLTNGVAVTEPLARRLAEIGTLTVEISLYSSTATLHDEFTRRPGSWQKALGAAACFRQAEVPVTLKVTLTPLNFGQMDEITALAASRDLQVQFFTYVSPTIGGDKRPLQFRMTDAMLTSALKQGIVRPAAVVCSAGRGKVWLCADGTVAACEYAREPLGNVADGGLAAAWARDRRATLAPVWDAVRPPACRDCAHTEYCPRCPGLARLEHGDYRAPQEEACRLCRLWASVNA